MPYYPQSSIHVLNSAPQSSFHVPHFIPLSSVQHAILSTVLHPRSQLCPAVVLPRASLYTPLIRSTCHTIHSPPSTCSTLPRSRPSTCLTLYPFHPFNMPYYPQSSIHVLNSAPQSSINVPYLRLYHFHPFNMPYYPQSSIHALNSAPQSSFHVPHFIPLSSVQHAILSTVLHPRSQLCPAVVLPRASLYTPLIRSTCHTIHSPPSTCSTLPRSRPSTCLTLYHFDPFNMPYYPQSSIHVLNSAPQSSFHVPHFIPL